MIKGKTRIELTIDTILERTTEIEIFNRFMPWKWELNQACISPFPGKNGYEKSPSFIIGNKYGTINYKAFNDDDKHGDCFSFVKQLHNLPNLDAVLRLIDTQLNLGISDGREIQSKPIIQTNKPEITKRNTLIQVITRKFTPEELKWWSSYHQDIEDLKREEIYSIKKAYLNKKLYSIGDDELRFGYYYKGTWKLYFPNSQNKRKKWLTNTPLVYLDGKENIKNCDTAWLTKSKKDKMVLLKLYSCVASTQNESIACFSEENVQFIKNNSKKQVILWDSDDAGVRSCTQVTNKFGFGYCNPPRKYLPDIKDISDLARVYGLQAVEIMLKEKKLI
jgi:hypothetical protein